MVVEYIRYSVEPPRGKDFEQAYSEAGRILDEAPECLGYEVSRCHEDPKAFTVRIEWKSIEEHEKGFRGSPAFGEFFQLVRPFFGQIQEMRHYEPLAAAQSN